MRVFVYARVFVCARTWLICRPCVMPVTGAITLSSRPPAGEAVPGAGERRVKQASVKTIAPYILYRTGHHQRLPRHLQAQQIKRAVFIFNCLGSEMSCCYKDRYCYSMGCEQDGIIPFNLSAFTLLLNELIRRYGALAQSQFVCCV